MPHISQCPRRDKLWEDESGSASVELALVFGLTVLILFAIIEFGLLMNARIVVTTAAREGARRAAVDGGASDAAFSRVRDILLSAGLYTEATRISIHPLVASYGSSITVRVELNYEVKTPAVSAISQRFIPVVAEVVFRSERVR